MVTMKILTEYVKDVILNVPPVLLTQFVFYVLKTLVDNYQIVDAQLVLGPTLKLEDVELVPLNVELVQVMLITVPIVKPIT